MYYEAVRGSIVPNSCAAPTVTGGGASTSTTSGACGWCGLLAGRGSGRTIRAIGKALETYRDEYGCYPIQATETELSLEILPRSYYTEPLQDARGREVRFRDVSKEGTSYTLISYGKDKTQGESGNSWDTDAILSGGTMIQPAY